jgi:hypothetical protein
MLEQRIGPLERTKVEIANQEVEQDHEVEKTVYWDLFVELSDGRSYKGEW